jgi:hypothetical protein
MLCNLINFRNNQNKNNNGQRLVDRRRAILQVKPLGVEPGVGEETP